ncbi:MAG: hypothetical protein ABGY96_30780 [bacterium]|nr:hypothetical protein [Gammaproteobacteria bacterium]HIL98624.1 hypothetical protein [Pseudomonadales bacterium]
MPKENLAFFTATLITSVFAQSDIPEVTGSNYDRHDYVKLELKAMDACKTKISAAVLSCQQKVGVGTTISIRLSKAGRCFDKLSGVLAFQPMTSAIGPKSILV